MAFEYYVLKNHQLFRTLIRSDTIAIISTVIRFNDKCVMLVFAWLLLIGLRSRAHPIHQQRSNLIEFEVVHRHTLDTVIRLAPTGWVCVFFLCCVSCCLLHILSASYTRFVSADH